jgi:hypothetical protein
LDCDLWRSHAKSYLNSYLLYAQITFTSLWPSLRQTIIEQIRGDIPTGKYLDSYHPVARILNLTKNELHTIMAENSHVWSDDEIPRHFLEHRRKNPDAIIDPDEPPPSEIVKAIRYLKQSSFPGSLLGEWQKLESLPTTEVFRPPFQFPSQSFDPRCM